MYFFKFIMFIYLSIIFLFTSTLYLISDFPFHFSQSLQKGKTSIAEMLFGMSLKETGIKRHPIRVRQRVLQYAVTVFLKENDTKYEITQNMLLKLKLNFFFKTLLSIKSNSKEKIIKFRKKFGGLEM